MRAMGVICLFFTIFIFDFRSGKNKSGTIPYIDDPSLQMELFCYWIIKTTYWRVASLLQATDNGTTAISTAITNNIGIWFGTIRNQGC